MLKHRNEQVQGTVRLLDVLVRLTAFFGAYWLRTSPVSPLAHISPEAAGPIDSLTWMLVAGLTLHFILYPSLGFYGSLRLKSLPAIAQMIFRGLIIEFFAIGTLVFLLQAKGTSRYFFFLYLGLNYSLLAVEKLGARILLASIRKRGFNYRQILIVGTGSNASRIIQSLKANKHWGYLPIGVLRPDSEPNRVESIEGIPVIGHLSDLKAIAEEETIDEIYFAQDNFLGQEVAEALQLTQTLGIPARFSMALVDLPQARITFNHLDQIPVITFYRTLMTPWEAALKRSMDLVFAIIGLAFTAVLYPWITWMIRRESPGPAIFKQTRIGENGRKFKCYKFRTMSLDAETRKAELAEANQVQGPMFKIKNDPRVTRFGAFLRKTSLDELPQFLNVLRGDMSIVGTRPPTPDEVTRYETHYRRRLSIRPGLTGLWQVSGRSQIQKFDEVLTLDLQYIDHWSIWLDLKIIFQTVWVICFRRGAV